MDSLTQDTCPDTSQVFALHNQLAAGDCCLQRSTLPARRMPACLFVQRLFNTFQIPSCLRISV